MARAIPPHGHRQGKRRNSLYMYMSLTLLGPMGGFNSRGDVYQSIRGGIDSFYSFSNIMINYHTCEQRREIIQRTLMQDTCRAPALRTSVEDLYDGCRGNTTDLEEQRWGKLLVKKRLLATCSRFKQQLAVTSASTRMLHKWDTSSTC